MDELLSNSILRTISLSGTASEETAIRKQLIATQMQAKNILNNTSGKIQISKAAAQRFELALIKPTILSELSVLEIRCCLCGKVISYPTWYLAVNYAVNTIHYFVCFNGEKLITTNCKRG